ncbi:hypothetical protein K438DRAFT_1969337 [Mycena galopus ATCC 62051]|nr:hypothetical protein K438DRAFT_1969337 [Mycena galopus ATCC 62051]
MKPVDAYTAHPTVVGMVQGVVGNKLRLICVVTNTDHELQPVRKVLRLGAALMQDGILTIAHKRIPSPPDAQLDFELIQEGATGGLVIIEDRPSYWDTCDVETHHPEKATYLEPAKVSGRRAGPLRASVRAWMAYEQSRISITISLDALPASTTLDSCSMLRSDAWVNWR